ncbi:centrosomal protein of 63 kDa-like [Clavelina lepadiformis]|uniref:centrosomal protein of 63 kDa-like n=1 Tax=Clavelina lepadiformis TaxID=159417 RepID=UPI0040412716
MDPSIWDCLEKNSGEGILLTSCGSELQELMRQIDIMVRNKKTEWETELATTQDCLALREQELAHSRALLDQKHHEIGVLKHQIEGYESGQKGVIKEYEAQLNRVKNQFKNLRDSHEKMQRQKTKRNQASADKEKELLEEVDHLKAELKEKRAIAIEHDKESSEWDIRKRALQHQIECLETQKRALAANYERVQHQLSVSQSRLKRSNRMVEEVEGTSQSLLKKLEEELAHDKELIQRQESLIVELQSKIRDLNNARHAATGEKYRFQEQSDKANCRSKVLEEEVQKFQAALSARESAIRGSEHEIADLKIKVEELKSSVQMKEKIIEAMQVRSPLKSKEDELRQKVATLEASIATMLETEKYLREEVHTLEEQLKSKNTELMRLNECLEKTECAKVTVVNDEIRRLRVKLEDMEASHSAQLCGMKAEVTNLTSHLHGRDANITRLTETCAEMEKQLRDEAQRRDKLDAELQTAAAHLHALRQQRNGQEEDLPDRRSTERSLTEAETQLTSLRQNYGKAVVRLEDENQQLKTQVSGLKNQLLVKDKVGEEQYSVAVQQTREVINEMKQKEDDRISEVCLAYESRIAALEAHIHEMQHQDRPPPLLPSSNSVVLCSASSDAGTMTPPTSKSDDTPSTERRVRTPTPTKEFLASIGIDPTSVNSSAVSFPASVAGSMDERQLRAFLGITDEGFDEGRMPTIEDFASEEEKRVQQLESKIEEHIGNMAKAMDQAMEKYFKKS